MKINDVKLKYSCPAVCPTGIYLDRVYSIGKDKQGYYFTDGNYTQYSELDFIKMLFTPKDCTWDEVEFDNKKSKDNISTNVDESVIEGV
jgi:hypothetical protein